MSSLSARGRGPRVQLSARRSARHADGHDDRPDRSRVAATTPRRAEIADAIYRVRRGALLAAHRAVASCRRGPQAPLETTAQLASIVRRAIPRRGFSRIDPATRTFQALRIWVNRELDEHRRVSDGRGAPSGDRGAPGGDHVSLARGSHRQAHAAGAGASATAPRLRILTKKPVTPQPDEIERNPRARSAKLRVAECVA